MENLFTQIDKLAQHSLPAIAKHLPDTGLFAGSIELNTKAEKYHPFATVGEATPIAYERTETMAAFVRQLCAVIATGQDRQFQPTMRASGALKGCKVIVCTDSDLPLPVEATRLQLPNGMSAYETANHIGEQAREHEAQIVIIDDATRLFDTWPSEAIVMLNAIAHAQGTLLLYGLNVTEANDNAIAYFARHAHNLCQLTEGCMNLAKEDGEPQTVNYFLFAYGRPTPHSIVYSIDESGNVAIPAHVTDLLRMQECGKLFAQKSINQTAFAHKVFGYLQGQYQQKSVDSMISEAVAYDVLKRSGTGKKHTTVCLSNTTNQRKPYKNNRAILAKLNPYIKETDYCKAYKPVALMGDFKILIADCLSCQNVTRRLAIALIRAVTTGEKQLDFKVVTPHRNTLVIVVGNDTADHYRKEFKLEQKGATLNVISTNGEITDGNFLSLYRASLNQNQPDFVFVLNYDTIRQHDYTPTQLAKEIATASKNGGIVTIAQMSEWNGNEPMTTGDEFWRVRPLVEDDRRMHYHERGYQTDLAPIYEFEANVEKFQFLCRFMFACRSVVPAQSKDQKETYYRATFYWCKQTPREEITEDCTGKELAYKSMNSLIYQAEKAGFIRVEYSNKRKEYKNAIITYIGN